MWNWGAVEFLGFPTDVTSDIMSTIDPDLIIGTVQTGPVNILALRLGYLDVMRLKLRCKISLHSWPHASNRQSCQLSAVKIGWVLSVYHQFYHGTHHFLALLAIVKWLRPELF